jgi:UPF0755 protein
VTWRRAAYLATALVAIVASFVGGVFLFLHSPGPALVEPATVTVPAGSRFTDVAHELVARGLLRHALPLVGWARLTGEDRAVRSGVYLVTRPLTPIELLARVTGPPDPSQMVTIPEGLTAREVTAQLAAAGYGTQDEYLAVLRDPAFLTSEDLPDVGAEGYLFPDTYAFPPGTSPDRILRTMVRRFRDVFTPDMASRAASHGLDRQQAVTLASLVEEEAARPDERRLVAAVFLNRLRLGMPLQSDPTVLYGRDGDDRTITRADLRRHTPHNTYTARGLPPTPIANPGRAALEAAVDPASVPFLYFVARGDGSHEFNVDLAAHNAAVQHWQRR